jgi:hypothetical protein
LGFACDRIAMSAANVASREPLGRRVLCERVAVDQHRGKQRFFAAHGVQMVLQVDLLGAVIGSSRELDCLLRAKFERCPQVVLSSEREAGALKKPGQAAPLDADGRQLALVVPSRVRDAKRVHAF